MQDLASTANDLTLGFGYNPASQIVSNTRSNDNFAFIGLANQNVTDAINGLNQVTATGATGITHDTRGNISAIGGSSYGYTSENMMISAPGSVTLAYDPLLRLYQTAGGTTTRFAYDGVSMIAEYNGSNVLQRRFVHGPGIDDPLVWYEGTGTSDRRWFHADERGSVIAVSDGSGNLVGSRNRYDEYGNPQGGSITGRFGYTGQAWLPEVNLWYYRARMFNPSLGRFMQTDPIGYEGGMNLYAYVRGDPINLSDPLGLKPPNPFPDQPADDFEDWHRWRTICSSANPLQGCDPRMGDDGLEIVITAIRTTRPSGGGYEDSPTSGLNVDLINRDEIDRMLFSGSETELAQRIIPRGTPPSNVLARPPVVPRPPFPYPGNNTTRPPGPGFQWQGRPGSRPGDRDGSWYNPQTHEYLRPDLNHRSPIRPHWDYRAPDGSTWRWFGRGDWQFKSWPRISA